MSLFQAAAASWTPTPAMASAASSTGRRTWAAAAPYYLQTSDSIQPIASLSNCGVDFIHLLSIHSPPQPLRSAAAGSAACLESAPEQQRTMRLASQSDHCCAWTVRYSVNEYKTRRHVSKLVLFFKVVSFFDDIRCVAERERGTPLQEKQSGWHHEARPRVHRKPKLLLE